MRPNASLIRPATREALPWVVAATAARQRVASRTSYIKRIETRYPSTLNPTNLRNAYRQSHQPVTSAIRPLGGRCAVPVPGQEKSDPATQAATRAESDEPLREYEQLHHLRWELQHCRR